AIGTERAVLQHQWDVVRAVWQLFVNRRVSLQKIEAGEPHIQVPSGVAPMVIVIPQRRCASGVAVLIAAHCPGNEAIGGVAVGVRSRDAPMQVNDGCYIKTVGVSYHGGSVSPRPNGRTRKRPVVTPNSRGYAGDDLSPCFALNHLVIVGRVIASYWRKNL